MMLATVSALWVANCGNSARAAPPATLRASHVTEIGHRLAGEHRIIGEPALLRPLDLGVPIGALDQPHRQPAVERRRRGSTQSITASARF